jgi:hypothetical protein
MEQRSFWKSKSGVAFLVFAIAGGYFLVTEHLAHTIYALPYLLILSCPLMHLFMHGNHSHDGSKQSNEGAGDKNES